MGRPHQPVRPGWGVINPEKGAKARAAKRIGPAGILVGGVCGGRATGRGVHGEGRCADASAVGADVEGLERVMEALTFVVVIAIVIAAEIVDYRRSPMCQWCHMRHRGRCIWNPRAGRVFANVHDGHFDVNDPNK